MVKMETASYHLMVLLRSSMVSMLRITLYQVRLVEKVLPVSCQQDSLL